MNFAARAEPGVAVPRPSIESAARAASSWRMPAPYAGCRHTWSLWAPLSRRTGVDDGCRTCRDATEAKTEPAVHGGGAKTDVRRLVYETAGAARVASKCWT
jgi:hypothetical protein